MQAAAFCDILPSNVSLNTDVPQGRKLLPIKLLYADGHLVYRHEIERHVFLTLKRLILGKGHYESGRLDIISDCTIRFTPVPQRYETERSVKQ